MGDEARAFFRDAKPYAVPESLDNLRGPDGAVVELPQTVLCCGYSRVDLNEEGGVGLAHRALMAEGIVADQVAILNRDRLIAAWPMLLLSGRLARCGRTVFPTCALV